ncbi:MAG: glycosyltransferase family 4 protein [Candidatus Colwellbacteria bacterium]
MSGSKNKILIATGVYPPDIGGPASYSKTLATKLKDSGATVLTYSPVLSYKDDKEQPYKIIRVWSKLPKGLKHLVYFFKAFSLAKKSDIVFALNAVSAGIPAMYAAKMAKKKFFVKIVGDAAWERAIGNGKTYLLLNDFQKTEKRGLIGILHKLQCRVCQNADGIIVPSQYLADIVHGWGVPKDKIKVIYNGVDFKPSELSKEEARRKIEVFGHIIVSAGRLVPWKGFRMLIKIMPQVFEINQAFRLIIVGSGPDKKTLESMVRNLGLERKVFLVGKKNQAELATYLAAADMFVLDTGYEGFSHQILEAMAAGVPVITTAVGGNKEVIEQGENGFLVRYNDEFNLVEAVRSLWQDQDLKEEFMAKGKKTAAKFSSEKMFFETIKFLNN